MTTETEQQHGQSGHQAVVSRQFDLTECLDFDAFQGDFGAGDEHLFANKIVTARKLHECWHCTGEIKPGDKHRLMKEKSDGELRTFRWCTDCCIGMVLDLKGHSQY